MELVETAAGFLAGSCLAGVFAFSEAIEAGGAADSLSIGASSVTEAAAGKAMGEDSAELWRSSTALLSRHTKKKAIPMIKMAPNAIDGTSQAFLRAGARAGLLSIELFHLTDVLPAPGALGDAPIGWL